ncbi:MAG: CDGSH iron-sulfur domain-containing protein [Mariprofundaceae bacterium]
MTKKLQTYEGDEITVNFDPSRCMHAGNCVRELPEVFRPESRGRWIFPDEADAEVLAAMVLTCPSGALTYTVNGVEHAGNKPAENCATIMPGGPLYLHAEMNINGEDQPTCRASLCRCGATQNPPYCDNSHKAAGFKDDAQVNTNALEDVATDCCLEIQSIKDGPLLIKGGCKLQNIKGEAVACCEQLVLCRCGASSNKPYCDGSHIVAGFKSK